MLQRHVMLDLETMGTRETALVCSIGAVVFYPDTGELGEEFYEAIDWDSGVNSGRTIDPSTIKWWLEQSEKARKAILVKDTIDWSVALQKLHTWFPSRAYVWSNGATFDVSILENAYRASDLKEPPWNYWSVRDVRTIKHLAQDIPTGVQTGTAHNALDDAKHQAVYVAKMWQHLKGKK